MTIKEVQNLTDQSALAVIAKNNTDADIRFAAVEKITDPEIVAYVAKNDKTAGVRKAVIESKTIKQSILADIAKNDIDEYVRKAAAMKIPSQDLHCNIGQHLWVKTDNCRKKCSHCGVEAYNHNYIVTKSHMSEDSRYEYACKNCGHEAIENSNVDSREQGYVK